jgi:hypothetical protein
MSENTRRRFLQLAGGATTVALAGCTDALGSGGDGGEGEPEGNDSMGNESMGNESMDDDSMDDDSMAGATFTVRIENVAPTDFYGSDSHTGGAIWITPGAYGVYMGSMGDESMGNESMGNESMGNESMGNESMGNESMGNESMSDGSMNVGSNPVFTQGEAASVGLEALAEAGPPTGFEGEPGLVDELGDTETVAHAGAFTPDDTVADPNDPKGEVPGAPPIAPGGAFEFEIDAQPGQRLSFATMFVPSNDLFFAPGADGIALFEEGEPVSGDVTDAVELWDAGTEPNGEPGYGPDQAPAQESADQGGDEGGVVRLLGDVDDGYDYPAADEAIKVTVSPM